MQNFTFHNPVKLLFGQGQIPALSREIPRDARVLMVYGLGSIRQNGVYDQVKRALEGYHLVEFSGIEANPRYETLMRAVALAREAEVDFLLAVGGGSVLDGAKFIAVAVPYPGDPWEIPAVGARPRAALPLGCVLTLPGTGSEMNAFSVVSRESRQEKLSWSSPLAFPRFSIVDPETTFSLPPRQVTNGVVDAFIHVLEQYLTYPAHAPLQDRFAESILQTLVEVGPVTLADPCDYEARAAMCWCTTLALNGLIGAGVPQDWSTHTLGHEITALYGLDHAQTLAILLPNLLWVQRESKREKLLQYGERLWGLREGSEAARLDAAIVRTREFFEAMGAKTHFSDYGIQGLRADEIVSRLQARKALPLGERHDLDEGKVRELLALCR